MNPGNFSPGGLGGHLDAWIEERGPAVSELNVRRLEIDLAARLPDDYRSFLRSVNGGLLPPNTIRIPGANWTPTSVFVVFGLGRRLDTSDLRWNMQTFSRQCLDQTLLPVACDPGGCPFCLVIDGEGRGTVIYIDLSEPEKRHFVAPTFSAFLATVELDHATDPARRSLAKLQMRMA